MSENSADPIVIEAVEAIENRFGLPGLEDLIAVAQQHLTTAREAMEELGDVVD